MPVRTTIIHRFDARRRLIVAVATFLLVSALVIRTSDAAFTADHVNADNAFAAATIDLGGDTTLPLFGDGTLASVADAGALYPGSEVEACIEITYSGDLQAADLSSVTVSIDGPPAGLADDLSVVVDLYDGCGGVELAGIASGSLYDVSGDDSTWTPSGDGDSRAFVFTVEVADDDDLQGESLSGVDITWNLETR